MNVLRRFIIVFVGLVIYRVMYVIFSNVSEFTAMQCLFMSGTVCLVSMIILERSTS